MNTPKFSIATVRIEEVGASAKAIHDVLTWIEKRQNDDGSWGNSSMLEKVIATCHCVMTLMAAGHPANDSIITNGIRFLTEGGGAKSDWSFWRFAPLMNIRTYQNIVAGDIESLSRRVSDGAAPHPDQLLEASVLKAHLWIRSELLNGNTDIYLNRLLTLWDENKAWKGRPDTTANVLSLLGDREFINKEEIITKSLDMLRKSAIKKGDSVRWGLGNVSTAYVLMGIAESWLWEDKELRRLAEKAASSLLIARSGDHWKAEDPPYGGNEDIKSPDYFTAAICRGIIAVHVRGDDTFILQLASLRFNAAHTELLATQTERNSSISEVTTLKNEMIRLSEKVTSLEKIGVVSEKITIPWMFKHLDIKMWSLLGSLVVGAFVLGTQFGTNGDKLNKNQISSSPANQTTQPTIVQPASASSLRATPKATDSIPKQP